MNNSQYNYPQRNYGNQSYEQNQQRFYGRNQQNYQDMGYYIPEAQKSEVTSKFPQQDQQYYQNHYQNYSQGNFGYNQYQNNNTNVPRGNIRNPNSQLNASVTYEPNLQKSFNNSFASEAGWNGVPEVGRFGGKKKKNRQLDSSISSNTQTKRTEPKVKQPTVKEESTNQFYFPVHTETTTYAQCPFNPTHMMEPDRLMTHINKCKLKSQNAKFFSVCPYDPCHYYYTTEIEAHILVCPKRCLFVVADEYQQTGNSSTALETPSASENELLQESSKAPSSKLTDQKKTEYEEWILKDV